MARTSLVKAKSTSLLLGGNAIELGYLQRSRMSTRDSLNQALRERDPWYQWHVDHVIGLVFFDKKVPTTLTPTALRVLIQTPYAGPYDEACRFLREGNLKMFVHENGLTHEKLAMMHGCRVADEITSWAHQLEEDFDDE